MLHAVAPHLAEISELSSVTDYVGLARFFIAFRSNPCRRLSKSTAKKALQRKYDSVYRPIALRQSFDQLLPREAYSAQLRWRPVSTTDRESAKQLAGARINIE